MIDKGLITRNQEFRWVRRCNTCDRNVSPTSVSQVLRNREGCTGELMNIIEVSGIPSSEPRSPAILKLKLVTILNCTVCNDVKSWRLSVNGTAFCESRADGIGEEKNRLPLLSSGSLINSSPEEIGLFTALSTANLM